MLKVGAAESEPSPPSGLQPNACLSLSNLQSSSRKHLDKEHTSTTSNKKESVVPTFSTIVPEGAGNVACRPHPDKMKRTDHSPKYTVQEEGSYPQEHAHSSTLCTRITEKNPWDNEGKKRTWKVKCDRIHQKMHL